MEQKKYLTVGNVLGETFNLYFSNFLLVCLPPLIVLFPFGQLQTYVTSLYGVGGPPWYVSIPSTLISLVLSYGVAYYQTIVVLKRYQNERADIKGAVAALLPRLFVYSVMNFMILFFSMLLTMLLIVPGAIYFAARSVADVAMVREGLGIRASIKRSRLITKKRRFPILICFVVLILLLIVLLIAYYGILGFTFEGGFSQLAVFSMAAAERPLAGLLYSLVSNCVYPLFTVMGVVVYMNLLKEKEGYATEQLADGFLEEKND